MENINIDHLVKYFQDGCKTQENKTIGIEIEHFVVNTDNEPATYQQISEIMKSMMKAEDIPSEENGYLLGYYNQDFSITLEPAVQLEISVMPQRTVEAAAGILEKFYKDYGQALQEKGLRMIALGYHPYKKAESLPLIPKKRYEYMNQYFTSSGTRGHQMMRATASTQVSIDYFDEQDFVNKYRLACCLVPILGLITDNSPIYEGEIQREHMARTFVWQDVDKERCLIPVCCFEADFGFEAYAKEMYGKPPILVQEQGETIHTLGLTIAEYYQEKELGIPEIEHLISMFFPDIRLKHYIEIRPADSMPLPYVLAYTLLIKGIFYRPQTVLELQKYLDVSSREEIEDAKKELIKKGYRGTIYKKSAGEVVDTIFSFAQRGLKQEEIEFMEPLSRLARKRVTLVEEYS